MEHDQLLAICAHFKLGSPTKPPLRVHGGLLHLMWRIETAHGSYAVKELSHHIDLENPLVIKNYNLSEKIASLFIQKGIPAIAAIKDIFNNYLYTGFLVYPWINAKAKEDVSEESALQIAVILAKMHQINLQIPELLEPEFDIHSQETIIELIKKSEFSNTLKEKQNQILKINQDYQNCISILKKRSVVSHGDLDPKNVLWNDQQKPFLIDWESARKLNPTYEIVNAALDWSGITTSFNKDLFIKMIDAYEEAGGVIDNAEFEASFHGAMGNWLHWMVYNINRSFSPQSEQKNMGIQQVEQVLGTISRLEKIMIKKEK